MTTDNEKIEKALRLDNSRILDVHKWSDYPEVNRAVAFIYSLFTSLSEYTGKANIQKRHIKTIIIDLYACWLSDPDMYLGYHRGNDAYKSQSRYNKIHITKITPKIVDALHELGYVEHYKGYFSRDGSGKSRISRMRATQSLIELITKSHAWTPMVVERAPDTECIILKDKDLESGNKIIIEYSDTAETVRMRQNLTKYNNLLRQTFIDIPYLGCAGIKTTNGKGTVYITQHEKFVRRIFNNGSFDQGGRFYGGWWQRIPQDIRVQIQIWNSPIIEIDYTGLHIIILYALAGIDYWNEIGSDPYDLPSFESSERMRILEKMMLLVAINAKDEISALKAIRYEINTNHNDYSWISEDGVDIESILKEFTDKHNNIMDYFFSGFGVKLQKLDSEMAEAVIKHFTNQGEVVLGVHDSFICRKDLADELLQLVRESFKSVVEKLGLIDPGTPRTKETTFDFDDLLTRTMHKLSNLKYDDFDLQFDPSCSENMIDSISHLWSDEVMPPIFSDVVINNHNIKTPFDEWEERMNAFRALDLEDEYYVADSMWFETKQSMCN